MSQKEEQEQIVEDLEQRIDTLQNMEDDDFGTYGRLDHIILVLAAVILPIIAMILAR